MIILRNRLFAENGAGSLTDAVQAKREYNKANRVLDNLSNNMKALRKNLNIPYEEKLPQARKIHNQGERMREVMRSSKTKFADAKAKGIAEIASRAVKRGRLFIKR